MLNGISQRIKAKYSFGLLYFRKVSNLKDFSHSSKRHKSHQGAKASWSLEVQGAGFCEVKCDPGGTSILYDSKYDYINKKLKIPNL